MNRSSQRHRALAIPPHVPVAEDRFDPDQGLEPEVLARISEFGR